MTLNKVVTLPSGTKWYKYDESAPAGSKWIEYPDAVISGNTVTVELQDGGKGDADGVVNGIIIDPSGPVGPAFDPYDPNESGGTTMADVLICYKQYLGIPMSVDYPLADVSGDGRVTMVDVLKIYKRYLGLS